VYRDAVPEVRVRASGSPDSGCAFEIVGLRLSHGSGDEIAVDWRVRTDSICQSASVPEVLAMRGGINERGVEHPSRFVALVLSRGEAEDHVELVGTDGDLRELGIASRSVPAR